MILSVAIPTYNRPDKILNTVKCLLSQSTDEIKIMILDNCSPVIVEDYLGNALGLEAIKKIQFVRHRVNIGADANFARCFELCETPYLWLLGDDDKIQENAIQVILEELENYTDQNLIGINFNSNCNETLRNSPVDINNINDLVHKLDSFGNWLFISTSVYKTEEYLKYIRYQTWGAYSMASQLVPAMMAISNNKKLVLSEKHIVTMLKASEEDSGGKWSDFQLAFHLSTLLDAPVGFRNNEYHKFGQLMECHFNCVYPGDALYIILKSLNNNVDLIDNYHIYIFRQLIQRSWEFRSRKITQALQYKIGLFLMKNKLALKTIMKLFPKISRKADQQVSFYLFER